MTNPSVPQYPEAGPAQSVVVVTDAEVVGGPAIPVYGWTGLPTDGRSVEGAPAMRVKVISASDLTINGGKFWLEGRPFAMPVSGSAVIPSVGEGNVAVAVYPVNAWPSVTPPPTPVLPQVASATLLLDLRASQLALSEGDPVSMWADASGNGNNFTQSGAARPTYRAGGGVPYVEFDGVDDWMLGPDFCDSPYPFAVFFAFVAPDTSYGPILYKIQNNGCDDPCQGWIAADDFMQTYQTISKQFYQGQALSSFPLGVVITVDDFVALSAFHHYTNGVNDDAFLPAGKDFGSGGCTDTTNTEPVRIGIDGELGLCDGFIRTRIYAMLIYRVSDYSTWNATDRDAVTNWLRSVTPTVLTYEVGEIGTVNASTLVANFTREPFASDFKAGVSITINGTPTTVLSGTKTGANTVQYLISDIVTTGQTVLFNYTSSSGNTVDSDSTPMGNITNAAVVNNT